MSAQTVETVLIRLASDEPFANLLLTNPEQALSSYDLTAQEIADFKAIDRPGLQKYVAASPEERKSMGLQHNELMLRAV